MSNGANGTPLTGWPEQQVKTRLTKPWLRTELDVRHELRKVETFWVF
jgi:hypothetical protein